MQDIPKIPFREIVKHKAVYMMLVAVSIAWFFVGKYTDSSKNLVESQATQIKLYQEREILHERSEERKDKVIDSLQALMLKRTDNSYQELKDMLSIDNTKSTIIIKPKRK